jgi:hypothetical protein
MSGSEKMRNLLVEYMNTLPNDPGTYRVINFDTWKGHKYCGIDPYEVKIYAKNDADAVIKWFDYLSRTWPDYYGQWYDEQEANMAKPLVEYWFNGSDYCDIALKRYEEITLM